MPARFPSSQSEEIVARDAPMVLPAAWAGSKAGALARHEADHVAVVPVREAHQLAPLLGNRHAGGDHIEAAAAQFRDQPLPFFQHDLALGAEVLERAPVRHRPVAHRLVGRCLRVDRVRIPQDRDENLYVGLAAPGAKGQRLAGEARHPESSLSSAAPVRLPGQVEALPSPGTGVYARPWIPQTTRNPAVPHQSVPVGVAFGR